MFKNAANVMSLPKENMLRQETVTSYFNRAINDFERHKWKSKRNVLYTNTAFSFFPSHVFSLPSWPLVSSPQLRANVFTRHACTSQASTCRSYRINPRPPSQKHGHKLSQWLIVIYPTALTRRRQIVHIQHTHPLPLQHIPNMIPHPRRPGRRIPIPSPQPLCACRTRLC